MKGFYVQNKRL